jgi:hypothetical protein
MDGIARTFSIVLSVLILGGDWYAIGSYHLMTERVKQLEQTAKDYADLKVSFDVFRNEVVFRKNFDLALRSNRASISQALQQAAHEDKAVADFLAAPLPERSINDTEHGRNDSTHT